MRSTLCHFFISLLVVVIEASLAAIFNIPERASKMMGITPDSDIYLALILTIVSGGALLLFLGLHFFWLNHPIVKACKRRGSPIKHKNGIIHSASLIVENRSGRSLEDLTLTIEYSGRNGSDEQAIWPDIYLHPFQKKKIKIIENNEIFSENAGSISIHVLQPEGLFSYSQSLDNNKKNSIRVILKHRGIVRDIKHYDIISDGMKSISLKESQYGNA